MVPELFLTLNRNNLAAVKTYVVAFMCALLVVLAGCSNNERSAFEGTGSPRYEGPDPIPRGGGVWKVGNPYEIAGETYYPREDTSYDEIGTASWYGERFHRRQTANGEWYDMTALTAAHPTLPMPVYVKVTNLENNRSVIVRVNDRGPYAHDRVIDMSKAAAEALDFVRQGTARVRVQYIDRAPIDDDGSHLIAMNERLRQDGLNEVRTAQDSNWISGQNRVATNDTEDRGPSGEVTQYNNYSGSSGSSAAATPAGDGLYVQAASFSDHGNAVRLQQSLLTLGPVEISPSTVGSRTYYRVRVGPLQDTASADQALRDVMAAGHRDARIVSN